MHRFAQAPSSPIRYLAVLLSLALVAPFGVAKSATLEVWIVNWNENTHALFESKLIPAFQQRWPGVDVNVTWTSWSNHRERLTVAIAAGVGPDVFQVGGSDTGWIAANQLAQPLTRYFDAWEHRDAVPSGIVASMTRDGEVWSVPYIAAPRTLVYLRDTFEVVGMDPDAPPSTWAEIMDVVRKFMLKEGDKLARIGLQLTLSGTNVFETWSPFLQQAGGRVATESLEPAFVSEEGVASLEFYRDLVLMQELHVFGTGGLSFWNNEIGMLISNSSTITNGLNQGLITFEDVVIAPPPLNKKRVATVFTDPLTISSTTQNPDLAWAFIEFLLEPENLAAYNETFGFVPPLISALDTEYVQTNPIVQAYGNVIQYAHEIPALAEYFDIRSAISVDLTEAVNGRLPVRTALEQAAAKWRALRTE